MTQALHCAAQQLAVLVLLVSHAEALQPSQLNGGNLVDIFQNREEELTSNSVYPILPRICWQNGMNMKEHCGVEICCDSHQSVGYSPDVH